MSLRITCIFTLINMASLAGYVLAADDAAPKVAFAGKPLKLPMGPDTPATFRSVDLANGTITVSGEGKGQKDQTYEMATGLAILIMDKKAAKEAAFTDLLPGQRLLLTLSSEGKVSAIRIVAGPSFQGTVQSLDEEKNILTVAIKQTTLVNKEFAVTADTQVWTLDELAPKGQGQHQGKLADLTPGTPVRVQMSTDGKKAAGIAIGTATASGIVKAMDRAGRNITVLAKAAGQLEEKTYALAQGVQVALLEEPNPVGDLNDVIPGTIVDLRLSSLDRKTVVGILIRPKPAKQK